MDRRYQHLSHLTCPILAVSTADASSSVVVKDYAPQQIRDMNARQIAGLTTEQKSAIGAALGRDPDVVERLGYAVAPPT